MVNISFQKAEETKMKESETCVLILWKMGPNEGGLKTIYSTDSAFDGIIVVLEKNIKLKKSRILRQRMH